MQGVVLVTYDHELTLISQTITEDEIGNQIPVETKKDILCGLKSIGRNEFYNAAATGLKPEITFIIHAYEYSGQKKVEFEGVSYNVIRTYATNFEEMELVCERIISTGDTAIKLIDHELVQGLKALIEEILEDVTIDLETKEAYQAALTELLEGW